LTSEEGFILSRLSFPMKVDQLNVISGFSNQKIFRIIFTLWLCGLVKRENWNSAFTDKQIEHILSAKLKLSEIIIPQKTESIDDENSTNNEENASNQPKVEKTEEELLIEFLERAENSISHYQVLDIEQTADSTLIKQSYFYLAKTFHPDKFHKEIGTERHKRLQDAFTKIAQAYETLKDQSARELYDFKLKRRLASLEKENIKTTGAKTTEEKQKQEEVISQMEKTDAAKRWFDKGFECLMETDYENAITLLARAVLLDDTSARYHAYYGKALGGIKKHKYQAEQELQKAIKLESKNTSYRIMLAELYLDFGLPKRAEGELNRLLAIEPNNKEAQSMLSKIS
ncbi:MAG: DnaJ domain-containing protein, partial [Pyrinomonadaceae bacterium]|nr:DnaJ domain-containing protein [Pyrinomonadaceae bacterium]